MILPSARLLGLAAALLAGALAASIYGGEDIWFVAAALIAAAAMVDAAMAARLPAPALSRRVPNTISPGGRTKVAL